MQLCRIYAIFLNACDDAETAYEEEGRYVRKTKEKKYSEKASNVYVPNANVAGEVLQYMNETMPKAVIGYTDDLSRMYRKNNQEFLRLRYYRTEQPAAQESPVEEQPKEQEEFWK